MELGANALANWGKLGVTASISTAVQVVPPTQVNAAFVLDKPAGTEMDAVLVICVWEKAICGTAKDSKTPSTKDNVRSALATVNREKFKRLNTFAIADKRTPNTYIVVLAHTFNANLNTLVRQDVRSYELYYLCMVNQLFLLQINTY